MWSNAGISPRCGFDSPQINEANDDTIVICYYDGGKQTLTARQDDYYSVEIDDAAWSAVALDVKTGAKKVAIQT